MSLAPWGDLLAAAAGQAGEIRRHLVVAGQQSNDAAWRDGFDQCDRALRGGVGSGFG